MHRKPVGNKKTFAIGLLGMRPTGRTIGFHNPRSHAAYFETWKPHVKLAQFGWP